jgi:hypothetical protein
MWYRNLLHVRKTCREMNSNDAGSDAQIGYQGVQLHVLSLGVSVWVVWWVYNWTTWIPNIIEYGKQITLLL